VSNFDDQNTPAKSKPTKLLPSQDRAGIAAQIAADNRAYNIVILDLRELTQFFDFFVIASGTSRRQMHAVSKEIDHEFEDRLGDKRLSISGYRESRWIVLDYGDIVVHLFEPETREFYALEELWGKAKIVPFVPKTEQLCCDPQQGSTDAH